MNDCIYSVYDSKTAVALHHKPTGIVVYATVGRNPHANLERCKRLLQEQLDAIDWQETNSERLPKFEVQTIETLVKV